MIFYIISYIFINMSEIKELIDSLIIQNKDKIIEHKQKLVTNEKASQMINFYKSLNISELLVYSISLNYIGIFFPILRGRTNYKGLIHLPEYAVFKEEGGVLLVHCKIPNIILLAPDEGLTCMKYDTIWE